MSTYTIDTKLLGEIEVTQSYGIVEDFDITLGGKDMTIHFQIFEDVADDSTIETVEDIIDNIPLMYEKGKNAIIDGMESNAVIKDFIDEYFYDDELDVYLDFFGVDSADKITALMLAEKLEPRAIVIADVLVKGKDSMIDCSFDFALPEEYTDQLLVIRFNDKHEIYQITHES